MPTNIKSAILFVFLFVFTSISLVNAATLSLTKIGALDLGGKMYTDWWYTGTNPTFQGKAAASATVSLKANDKSFTGAANTSGDWSIPTVLDKGDYNIEVTSGTEKITFRLHLGQNLPANPVSSTVTTTTGQSTTAVPNTGLNQTSSILLGIGLILLATYFYVLVEPSAKKVFEQGIIKE